MTRQTVSIKLNRSSARYDIQIGVGLLGSAGEWARGCTGGRPGRIALISNPTVFDIYGEAVERSFAAAGFDVKVYLIGDGERFKNFRTLQRVLNFLEESQLTRTDAVAALGGGVVGDLAGFAASIYLRGIAFLQIPTTLLSMIDSSVGGKTGINTTHGKNLIGSFYQPNGVLIDVDALRTLPKRELTAGFCEAVKQGAIDGTSLFRKTDKFLERYSPNRPGDHFDDWQFSEKLSDLLAAQVAFKAKIVQGDERESPGSTGAASRKILNFGHTLAHSLEKVTDYRYLKHGEAVGYGIIFAAELSKKLELLSQNEVKLLKDVVQRAGVLPTLRGIDSARVIETFKYDKKLINDSLHWVLLKGIGKPVIVPNNDIPRSVLRAAIDEILDK